MQGVPPATAAGNTRRKPYCSGTALSRLWTILHHPAIQQQKTGHAKAHTSAEKEAEHKLIEMERNL
jgi:hypothetical protein